MVVSRIARATVEFIEPQTTLELVTGTIEEHPEGMLDD